MAPLVIQQGDFRRRRNGIYYGASGKIDSEVKQANDYTVLRGNAPR